MKYLTNYVRHEPTGEFHGGSVLIKKDGWWVVEVIGDAVVLTGRNGVYAQYFGNVEAAIEKKAAIEKEMIADGFKITQTKEAK